MDQHCDSFWGEEDLVDNYRLLSPQQRVSVNKQIANMLSSRQAFDWSHLAEAWPNIWDVVAEEMDGFDFEDLVAIVLAKHGFEYAASLRRTRDEGVDLYRIASNDGIIVECKLRGMRDVGAAEVRSLVGACVQHGIGRGMIVTNAHCTSAARATADRTRAEDGPKIDLVDNRRLDQMIRSAQCAELREFFAHPNLSGLQELLRGTKRTETYIQRRLDIFGR